MRAIAHILSARAIIRGACAPAALGVERHAQCWLVRALCGVALAATTAIRAGAADARLQRKGDEGRHALCCEECRLLVAVILGVAGSARALTTSALLLLLLLHLGTRVLHCACYLSLQPAPP